MKRRLLACAAGLFVFSLLLTLPTRAQVQTAVHPPGSDGMKQVKILNADRYSFKQVDSVTGLTILIGHVKIQQETTLIDCDSLVMNPHENYIECFDHVHINDNDSTNIYSDYMKYLVDTKLVHFDRNVTLTDGKGVLTTQDLDYDMNTRIGTYNHGGKIVNKESVLTSDRGVYFEATKDVHFKDNVIMRDPQYDLSADSLLYNTQTQISTFITWTDILFKDSTHRTVHTRSGFYDLKNKQAEFGTRPTITDGSQIITGDKVVVDDSTGISTATGDADYRDTAQGIRLLGGYMISNRKKNTFMATAQPLLILKQDKDSIYVTADTLMSRRLVDYEKEQKILAHQDSLHRIYVDSLERISADSLHRVAVARRYRDSVKFALGLDTTEIEGRDRSDSLAPGVADSLARLGLDSLRKLGFTTDSLRKLGFDSAKLAETDTTVKKLPVKIDSSQPMKIRAQLADTSKSAVTGKKRERLEKTLIKAESDSVKMRIQLVKDSIEKKIRAHKDSISDAKYDAQVKIKAARDSVKAAAKAAKQRQRDYVDSVRKAGFAAKARVREVADSIKRAVETDSLIAHTLARGDSVRILKLADSLKHGGWKDSLLTQRGLPIPVDSFALRRTQDSIREVVAAKAYADSIAHLPPTDSTLRYIIGYHHVRIFSDSLQAVSDSLYYSTKDSIFRLYYNPVAWGSGNYQITGDTMYVYTKNKKAERLYVFENALAVNKVARVFYNQLKGTTINCYFENGDIHYIRAKGNAESIYYMQGDDKAYTGVDHSHADIIDMVFAPKTDSAGNIAVDSAGKPKGKELNRIVLRSDAEGSVIPMHKVNFDEMVLRGFKWQEKRRPKSKQELFESIKNPNADQEFEEAEKEAIQAAPSQKAPIPSIPIVKPKPTAKKHP
jgi:lipopolysaccharide export system protein LptA